MIERKTWEEFRDTKLLWWINRSLHLFGWAIIVETDKFDNIVVAYPARVIFRGFTKKVEEDGFKDLSKYLLNNIKELEEEANE